MNKILIFAIAITGLFSLTLIQGKNPSSESSKDKILPINSIVEAETKSPSQIESIKADPEILAGYQTLRNGSKAYLVLMKDGRAYMSDGPDLYELRWLESGDTQIKIRSVNDDDRRFHFFFMNIKEDILEEKSQMGKFEWKRDQGIGEKGKIEFKTK